MKRLRTKFALLPVLLVSLLGLSSLVVASPFAAQSAYAQSGIDEATKGAESTGANNGGDFNTIAKAVINILSWVVGVAAVVMIIIGGFKYVTSSGDSGSIASAKNTLVYALVGLVIVLFAQVIVIFVLNAAKNGAPQAPPAKPKLEEAQG